MANFNQQLVALTMATLRADGKVDTAEVEVIKRVANDLEIDAATIETLLKEENEKQSIETEEEASLSPLVGPPSLK